MKWIIAKLAWGLSLAFILATTAQGATITVSDIMGVPPMLLWSMMAGMVAVGMAWGDIRRRMMDVEKDVRELKSRKDRNRDEEE